MAILAVMTLFYLGKAWPSPGMSFLDRSGEGYLSIVRVGPPASSLLFRDAGSQLELQGVVGYRAFRGFFGKLDLEARFKRWAGDNCVFCN